MIKNIDTDWSSQSDQVLIRQIGIFVRKKRLEINKTQAQVARDAGINRLTLSKLEQGESITLTSLIQVLRVLDLLDFMNSFVIDETISPIEYAKLKENERKRARNKEEEIGSMEDLEW